VVLIAHRGRPGGNYSRANFTLEPCVQVLQEHFPTRVVRHLITELIRSHVCAHSCISEEQACTRSCMSSDF